MYVNCKFVLKNYVNYNANDTAYVQRLRKELWTKDEMAQMAEDVDNKAMESKYSLPIARKANYVF